MCIRDRTVKLLMGTALSRAVTYKVVKDFAKAELMSGVTTIRTVGGLADFDTRVRDDIRNGKADGPRILAANEGISVPGGHMAGSVAVAANNIDEALVQVDIAKSQNVDLIKLMITGGVLDAKAKEMCIRDSNNTDEYSHSFVISYSDMKIENFRIACSKMSELTPL